MSAQSDPVPTGLDPLFVLVNEDMTATERADVLRVTLNPSEDPTGPMERPLWVVTLVRGLWTARIGGQRAAPDRLSLVGLLIAFAACYVPMFFVPLGLTWIPFIALIWPVLGLLGYVVERRPIPTVLVKPVFLVVIVGLAFAVAIARHLMGNA